MIKNFITIALFIGAIFVLLSLSYWQVERLQWKQDIIERLEVQYQTEPAPVISFDELQNFTEQSSPLIYGQITGVFDYNKEILWGPKPLNGDIGYNIITPLQLMTGEYVLVNRGWIDQSNISNRPSQSQTTPITITGLFRKPEWNFFTPENSPKNNVWTKPDIEEIARVRNISPVAPVMLYAHNMSVEFKGVILDNQKWYPRNKHKQYAIFWFVMGLAFIGVFSVRFYIKK